MFAIEYDSEHWPVVFFVFAFDKEESFLVTRHSFSEAGAFADVFGNRPESEKYLRKEYKGYQPQFQLFLSTGISVEKEGVGKEGGSCFCGLLVF